jgi:hypothetical protein
VGLTLAGLSNLKMSMNVGELCLRLIFSVTAHIKEKCLLAVPDKQTHRNKLRITERQPVQLHRMMSLTRYHQYS